VGDLRLVTATAPYSGAVVTGKVFEQQAEATRTGLSNAVFKMSVNLRGNPAMSPQEFKAAPQRVSVGAPFDARSAYTSVMPEMSAIPLITRFSFPSETSASQIFRLVSW